MFKFSIQEELFYHYLLVRDTDVYILSNFLCVASKFLC